VNDNTIVGYIVISAVVSVILFLIFREVVCWYYKINRMVSLMEDVKSSLLSISQSLSRGTSTDAADISGVSAEPGAEERGSGISSACPSCGKQVPADSKFCENCGHHLR
jgi:hypothetical protein